MNTKMKCSNCGDIIESKHRHDFVMCSCGGLFVDGGSHYFRAGGDYVFTSEILDDPSNQLDGEQQEDTNKQ